MDETVGDGAKNPGPFQQRYAPAVESEDAIAGSMHETTDDDFVATTQNTPAPVNWDQVNRRQKKHCRRRHNHTK